MAKWTKNHMLEIGAVLGILGLILTAISWVYALVTPPPEALRSYGSLVSRPEGNYNLLLQIGGPILLIIGAFYGGEQIVLRRRFERLIDTPKRSEFTSRRKDLEDLARRLPEGFNARIRAKEEEFASTTSRRSA